MARARVVSVDSVRQDAKTLVEILKDVERLPGADPLRIAEVRAEVAAMIPSS